MNGENVIMIVNSFFKGSQFTFTIEHIKSPPFLQHIITMKVL